jgi:hypothetical protein
MAGCAGNAELRQGLDQARAQVDRRNYEGARRDLERLLQKYPGDPSVTLLLAETELGLAGLGVFDFIEKALGPQTVEGHMDRASPNFSFDSLFLNQKCTVERIQDPKKYDHQGCLTLRLIKNVPVFGDPHLSRALSLLDAAFPNVDSASSDVNFLSAYVNALSAMSRIKLLAGMSFWEANISQQDPYSSHWGVIFGQLKRLRNEGMTMLIRGRASYSRVMGLVGHLYGRPIIHVGQHQIVFGPDTDYSDFYHFVASVIYDTHDALDQHLTELVYDRLGGALAQLQASAIETFGKQRPDALASLAPVDLGPLQGWLEGSPLDWLDPLVGGITQPIFDLNKRDRATLNWAEFVLRKPPRIMIRLGAGFHESWDQETDEPFNDSLRELVEHSESINKLRDAWRSWFGAIERDPDHAKILLWDLMETVVSRRNEWNPGSLDDFANLIRMEYGLDSVLEDELSALAVGKLAPTILWADGLVVNTHLLLLITQHWMKTDLWSLDDLADEPSPSP